MCRSDAAVCPIWKNRDPHVQVNLAQRDDLLVICRNLFLYLNHDQESKPVPGGVLSAIFNSQLQLRVQRATCCRFPILKRDPCLIRLIIDFPAQIISPMQIQHLVCRRSLPGFMSELCKTQLGVM